MTRVTSPATWLAGYIPDIPTPFDEKGRVDLAAFAKLCERQIEAGVTAIAVCETTGEASTLTPVEPQSIVGAAVEVVRRRARVIAGAGSNSTSQAVELTRRAERAGADAVLSVVPYYNKPMQAGIYAHFRAIAEATSLPVILHDVPSRTLRELSDDTLVRLAESQQFIGLLDGTGDIARALRLRSPMPSRFRLLSGDDATALAFIANGGDGSISMITNVAPTLCQEIYSNCRQGRLQSARHLQNQLAPLTASLCKESPAALKYALCRLGLMRAHTRLPIVELADPAKAEVDNAMVGIGEDYLCCPGGGSRRPRLRRDTAAAQ
jgi:4-hydroxy-tetrahydrodipicolinate synthase